MSKKIARICFNNYCLHAELADTFFKKAMGLMFRKKLEEDSGMLFLFRKERIISIWMLNMRIPLDIIWINANKEIVYIERNVMPCRSLFCPAIHPKNRAKYVLEINAGVSRKLKMDKGSVFDIINV